MNNSPMFVTPFWRLRDKITNPLQNSSEVIHILGEISELCVAFFLIT